MLRQPGLDRYDSRKPWITVPGDAFRSRQARPLPEITHPRGDLLVYRSDASQSVRVQIAGRPSGTEPKIKFYLFCQSDVINGNLDAARTAGDKACRMCNRRLVTGLSSN